MRVEWVVIQGGATGARDVQEADRTGQEALDGRLIRRAAVDLGVPLITNLALARRVVRAMDRMATFSDDVTPWQAHLH